MNTPGYFCLDKLQVRESESTRAGIVSAGKGRITYDRTTATVSVTGADFVAVYDACGNKMLSAEGSVHNLSHLSAGIYVVRAGDAVIKIAR